MTKENIYTTYQEDPLFTEKNYIKPENVGKLKLIEPSGVKLLEVIKMAINGNIDNESEAITIRKINQYLNK
jgi:hypothetical protein